MKNIRLTIQPGKICLIFSLLAALLVMVSICLQFLKFSLGYDIRQYQQLFDVSLEQNLPTFFTVLLLLLIALISAAITYLNYAAAKPFTSKWAVLSLGFVYMAYDEGFHVHENLVAVVRPLLGDGRLGIIYYAWVVPGMIVVFLLFLFFSRFLLFLSLRTRLFFVASAAIYLTGCIGMELVGGYYDELYGWNNLKYNMISSLEESLEMAGLILFIHALLKYIAIEYREVSFKFD